MKKNKELRKPEQNTLKKSLAVFLCLHMTFASVVFAGTSDSQPASYEKQMMQAPQPQTKPVPPKPAPPALAIPAGSLDSMSVTPLSVNVSASAAVVTKTQSVAPAAVSRKPIAAPPTNASAAPVIQSTTGTATYYSESQGTYMLRGTVSAMILNMPKTGAKVTATIFGNPQQTIVMVGSGTSFKGNFTLENQESQNNKVNVLIQVTDLQGKTLAVRSAQIIATTVKNFDGGGGGGGNQNMMSFQSQPSVSNITSSSASFAATILNVPQGSEVQVRVWKDGTTRPSSPNGYMSSTDGKNFTANIPGLNPNTKYRYEVMIPQVCGSASCVQGISSNQSVFNTLIQQLHPPVFKETTATAGVTTLAFHAYVEGAVSVKASYKKSNGQIVSVNLTLNQSTQEWAGNFTGLQADTAYEVTFLAMAADGSTAQKVATFRTNKEVQLQPKMIGSPRIDMSQMKTGAVTISASFSDLPATTMWVVAVPRGSRIGINPNTGDYIYPSGTVLSQEVGVEGAASPRFNLDGLSIRGNYDFVFLTQYKIPASTLSYLTFSDTTCRFTMTGGISIIKASLNAAKTAVTVKVQADSSNLPKDPFNANNVYLLVRIQTPGGRIYQNFVSIGKNSGAVEKDITIPVDAGVQLTYASVMNMNGYQVTNPLDTFSVWNLNS